MALRERQLSVAIQNGRDIVCPAQHTHNRKRVACRDAPQGSYTRQAGRGAGGGRPRRCHLQCRPKSLRCPAPLRVTGESGSCALRRLGEGLFFVLQLGKERLTIDAVPPAKRLPARINLLSDHLFAQFQELVPLFQELQRFAHHFAGGVIAATLNLSLDQLCKLGGQM
jgi:hypothetical protein